MRHNPLSGESFGGDAADGEATSTSKETLPFGAEGDDSPVGRGSFEVPFESMEPDEPEHT
jgi:hypothetical protein